MHRLEGFIALVVLPLLGGCGEDAELCGPLPHWAVAVDVRDSVTDRSVVAEARGAVFLTLTARLQPAAQ